MHSQAHNPQPGARNPEPAFISSRDRTRDRSWWLQAFGWLSSLQLAAVLIASFAFIIFVGTWYEKEYGREAAARFVYQAWWFDAFFALLALNILGAALVRLPWKRRHVGFVVVHAGLLTLIAGFVITGHDRLDGTLITERGKEVWQVQLPDDRIGVVTPDGRKHERIVDPQALAGYPSFARFVAGLVAPNPSLGIHRFDPVPLTPPDAPVPVAITGLCIAGADALGWSEGTGGAPRVGISAWMRTPMDPVLRRDDAAVQWLVPGGMAPAGFGRIAEGQWIMPASVHRFHDFATSTAFLDATPPPESGELVLGWKGRVVRWPIGATGAPLAEVPLDATHVAVIDRVALRPRLDQSRGELLDDPQSTFNPMVVYSVHAGAPGARALIGRSAVSLLYVFPSEEGMPDAFLRHPARFQHQPGGMTGALDMAAGADQRMHMRWWTASRGLSGTRSLPSGTHRLTLVGDSLAEAGMRLDGEITWLTSAVPSPTPLDMKPELIGQATRWYELTVGEGTARRSRWLKLSDREAIDVAGGGSVLVSIASDRYDLKERHGVTVTLDEFFEGRDPGGMGVAAYTSRVTLRHADGRPPRTVTTVMNAPVESGSLTLYQGSVLSDPDGGMPRMAFTASTDRGLWVKYAGSAILVLGVLLMYLLRILPSRPRAAETAP